ncbi:hypothetical protein SISSUDRAFT_1033250 [Sistotremastrum suecicum HHB10207 ss-3]|uniref:Uncharacterized protein n=1 Tax=Sistotremastrum suecicum HHB10207 ss-3 TaxID=1314776 RepID=A0A166DMB6_9AGAM|nr:hypothetical protein SISSUDRAFT_1033250 [Sistotremastrum suecicum HHB10207 ss-3]
MAPGSKKAAPKSPASPRTRTKTKEKVADSSKKKSAAAKKKGGKGKSGRVIDVDASDSDDDGDDVEEDAGEILEMDALGEIPQSLTVKKESTKDLLTIFSCKVKVRFTLTNVEDDAVGFQHLVGRWCLLCR